jgi:hypothetical protein
LREGFNPGSAKAKPKSFASCTSARLPFVFRPEGLLSFRHPEGVWKGRLRLHPCPSFCSRRNRSFDRMQCLLIRSLPFPTAMASYLFLGYPSRQEQDRIHLGFYPFRFRREEPALSFCPKQCPGFHGKTNKHQGRTYSVKSRLPCVPALV